MRFVIFEILAQRGKVITIPVMLRDVSQLAACFETTPLIQKYKVIDTVPVPPEHFGLAPIAEWDKWVLTFQLA